MTLRVRLLLAQGPLAVALVLIGIYAVWTIEDLGKAGDRILADNFRSVLAAQRMKEYAERIDSAALFIVAGEQEKGVSQMKLFGPKFEEELQVEESNITEPGEADAAGRIRRRWQEYQRALDEFIRLEGHGALKARYLQSLEPTFMGVKDDADVVLSLNQDAMSRKSDALRRRSERSNNLTVISALLALVAGLVASTTLIHRALRPVGVLSQAVRRVGQGDLAARAQVRGGSELEQLARDFNAMSERLQSYRQSSLGELLHAQQSSQSAIDSLPDPVVVFSADGSVLSINRSAERLLGLSIELDQEPMSRVAPALREVLERARAHVLAGKGPYVPRGYEEAVRVEGPDGPTFLLPRASPVYAEETGITGATVVMQDVTRLKRFDELKNDLVATVAHEFRTPLTSLRMAIHLCLEGTVGSISEKQADLLQAAREDCERLQSIVDDLLDLSRLQAGRLELEVRSIKTDELCDGVIGAVQSEARRKRLHVSCSVERGAEVIEADPERLSLVLNNLVTNAIRHTPDEGQIDVRAKLDDGRFRFEVRDTGVGISAEHQKRIFEKFYRVPGQEAGGAGLGLSIARDIVVAHGGDIGVESTPGLGSLFWFTLPRTPPRQS